MTRVRLVVVAWAGVLLALPGVVQAQSAQEAADWLKGLNVKLNYKEASAELVATATSVSFDGLARDKKLNPADLAKLAVFPKLKDVGLGNASGSDAAVAELVKAVPKLETLSVHNSAVTDAAFADIAKLTELKGLKMFMTKVTPAAMTHVAKLTKLRDLDVSSTAIGDAGLEAIKALPELRGLWFNSMKGVTRKGMAAMGSLPKLENVVLQFAEINEEIEELAKAPALWNVTLMSSKLDDAGGQKLGKLTNVRWLFVWHTKITDKSMKAIASLPKLETIYLDETGLTDVGLKEFAKAQALQTLWVSKTAVTDAGIAALAKLPKLSWIRMEETKITDKSLQALSGMKSLSSLGVGKTAVTDAAIAKFKETNPKIRVSK